MSGFSLGDFVRESLGISGPPPVDTKIQTPDTVAADGKVDITQSSIEKSAEKLAQEMIASMSTPQLTQFVGNARADAEMFIITILHQVKDEIINDMLDAWGQSVDEAKEMDKEAERDKIRLGLDEFSASSADAAGVKGKDNTVALVGALMMIAAASIGGAAGATPGTAPINADPTAVSGLEHLTETIMELAPPGLQASMYSLAAMITLGTFYFPLASVLKEEASGGSANFSESYSNQVANLINSGAIAKLINSTFVGVDEGVKKTFTVKLQALLLISALAVKHDWNVVISMLVAGVSDDPLMQALFAELAKLSPAEREKTEMLLRQYVYENAAGEELTQPYDLLKTLFSGGNNPLIAD